MAWLKKIGNSLLFIKLCHSITFNLIFGPLKLVKTRFIFYEKKEFTYHAMQPTIKIYFCFFFTSRWSLSITSIMCLRHYMLSSLFLPFKVIQYFLASEHINSLNIYKWAMVLCYKVSRPFRQLHSTYSQHVNKAKIRYVCISMYIGSDIIDMICWLIWRKRKKQVLDQPLFWWKEAVV